METESTCTRCGVPFTWERKHKEVRLYCLPCRQGTRKVQLDEARAKYAQSDRGKATNAASTRRWKASEKGRQYTAEWARTPQRREWLRQWRRAEERQRLHREWFRGYRETIAYRLPYRVRAHARGGYSVERLAVVARGILEGSAACYSCGCPATEIDHVLPVKLAALFGLFDEVDNYVNAMCKSCHRAKSVMDTRDIKRCRRELLTMPEQA